LLNSLNMLSIRTVLPVRRAPNNPVTKPGLILLIMLFIIIRDIIMSQLILIPTSKI